MEQLSLTFLGRFYAQLGQQPIPGFRTKATQALLIYLACQPDKPHRREHLMTLLWPGLPQKSAQANLRQTLYQLRQAIPETAARDGSVPVTLLLSDWQTVGINPKAAVEVDVLAFEALLAEGEASWATAVDLYQGDFLADFYLPDSQAFEAWTLALRQDLRAKALKALEALAEHALKEGDLETAETYSRRELAVDNLRESAHRRLMRILAEGGARTDALLNYEGLVQLLHEELGVEPSAETQELYESIRADSLPAQEIQPTKISKKTVYSSFRPTLPPQVGPLLGREKALEELKHLLTNKNKLVNIIGPGGMGKTRLALALGHQLVSCFEDGAAFVSLTPISEPVGVVRLVAQALRFEIQDRDIRPPEQQLIDYLKSKKMLLILDNFEHLLQAAPLLSSIVQFAPGVTIITTSREKLNLQIEQLYPLYGLALSDWDSLEKAEQDPALQLFCHHATRVRSDFQIQEEQLEPLHQLIKTFGGMPLAIILSAGWVELLSPAEILDEIGKSIDFLESDLRDMPDRHRSLRAVFEVTWGRLKAREQQIYAALSIFKGGFTLEAARQVTGSSPRDLLKLVDQSLLVRTEKGRFEIHELLRQFGAEMMRTNKNQENAIREQHSAYFCNFLHERTNDWHNYRQLETLAEVSLEAENAKQAINWALNHGKWQSLYQAIDCWGWYHDWTDQELEGVNYCQTIVEMARSEEIGGSSRSSDNLLVWARALGWLIFFSSDYEIALNCKEEGLALLKKPELSGNDTRREKAFLRLCYAFYLVVTAPDKARILYNQLLDEYQELGDEIGINMSLQGIARIDFDTAHFSSALERFEALQLKYQQQGNRRGRLIVISMLAFVKLDLGQIDDAEQLQWQAIKLAAEIDYKMKLGWRYANLARTLLWQGKLLDAYEIAREAIAIEQDLGIRASVTFADLTLCGIKIYDGSYNQARQDVTATITAGMGIGVGNAFQAWLSHLQGLLSLIDSEYREAQSAFECSVELWHSTFPHHFIPSLTALSLAHIRLGYLDQARITLTQSLSKAFTHQTAPPVLAAFLVAALLSSETGHVSRAVEIWTLANRYPFIANSKWFQDILARDVQKWTAVLTPESFAAAQKIGRSLDLWKTAASLLQQLSST